MNKRRTPLSIYRRGSHAQNLTEPRAFSKIHLTFSLDTPIIKSTGDACW